MIIDGFYKNTIIKIVKNIMICKKRVKNNKKGKELSKRKFQNNMCYFQPKLVFINGTQIRHCKNKSLF